MDNIDETLLAQENKRLKHELDTERRFITQLSHRLRTPLNAIAGMTALARRNLDDRDVVLDYLNKIDFSSRILCDTVSELTNLNAMECGELIVVNAPFDFKLLLSSISSMFFQQCNDKGIQYDIALSNVTEETLIGDGMRLNQLLFTLLSNAIAATDSGGHIKLRVAQHITGRGRVLLHFSVIDSGFGFSRLELEELFSAAGSAKTGVTFAVAKKLAELMGGRFAAESHKGMGSTFSVTIPFGIIENESPISKQNLGSYRVLLAGVDEQTLESITELLVRAGVEFSTAPTAEMATALLAEAACDGREYDLCFVDWSISAAKGIETVKTIRKNISNNKLHLAVILAADAGDMRDVARALGADTALPKPLFQSTVFNLLMELFGKHYTRVESSVSQYDFSGFTALLCEDNDLNAELAKELLLVSGMKSDRAENGEEAIEIFSRSKPHTYDIILMDIQMPLKNGYETTEAIRAMNRPDSADIPIVALTADAFAADVSRAKAAGMNDYVTKPIDTTLLYQVLKRNLVVR